jgi:hypothetical protein
MSVHARDQIESDRRCRPRRRRGLPQSYDANMLSGSKFRVGVARGHILRARSSSPPRRGWGGATGPGPALWLRSSGPAASASGGRSSRLSCCRVSRSSCSRALSCLVSAFSRDCCCGAPAPGWTLARGRLAAAALRARALRASAALGRLHGLLHQLTEHAGLPAERLSG